MKTKKSNLDSFKTKQLTSTEYKQIKCGQPGPPPGSGGGTPVAVVRPGGGLDNPYMVCYHDYNGALLYCLDEDGNEILSLS